MNMDALFNLTNGLYILGANDKGRYVGSLVDAITQVAHDPAIIVVSCNNQSYTKEIIEQTGVFSLSVLCKNVEPFVLANFGFQSSRNVNKWNNVDFCVEGGLPYLKYNNASMSCKVLNKINFSSNVMFIAEVLSADTSRNEDPLTYRDYRGYFKTEVIKSFEEYKKLSKNTGVSPIIKSEVAAKAVEAFPLTSNSKPIEENKMDQSKKQRWVCTVCGYVYDEELPFEDLPDDWVCPLCGVDKSLFELREV